MEIKILTQGETITLAKVLIKKTRLVEFMRIKPKHTGDRQEFYVPANSLERWVWFSMKATTFVHK